MIPLDYASRSTVRPPNGREAIYEFAGFNVGQHITAEGKLTVLWEASHITRVPLPRPLKLSYAPEVSATKIAVHVKAAESLSKALVAIDDAKLWPLLDPFGGGFEFRRIGGSDKLSLHSLGLAIDFDPAHNARDQRPENTRFGGTPDGLAVVRLFELHGWFWGGRFTTRFDAMHFQFGTGA
jgi:hypothetical protein